METKVTIEANLCFALKFNVCMSVRCCDRPALAKADLGHALAPVKEDN